MQQNKKNIPALEKCLKILNILAEQKAPLSASEISKKLVLPRSTVHGLLHTLVNFRVLRRGTDQKYFLGPHIMYWANSFLSDQDIVTIFYHEIRSLRVLDNYTLTVSVREKEDVLYLACRNAEIPLGFFFRPGMKLPAAFTSTGKALLATLSDEKITEIYSQNWPRPMTQNSVRNVSELLEEIHNVRKNGFSIDNGQIKEGMYCIGKAVHNSDGTGCAGISVSLLKEDFSQEAAKEISGYMEILVTKIETQMGVISSKPNLSVLKK